MDYGDFKDLPQRAASLIKYYVLKHLMLLKIRNMMGVKAVSLSWFIIFLIKSLQMMLLKARL